VLIAKRKIAVATAVAVSLVLAAGAGAALVKVGPLTLRADGGFAPRHLPRHSFAPIHFQGHASITTTEPGPPPALQQAAVNFDRDGHLTTTGLPTCSPSSIAGTSPERARSICADAIVGFGQVSAEVELPGVAPIEETSPLTLFNGPRVGGNPTVVFHAQGTYPGTETYVVVMPIERLHGAYAYRTILNVPPIAGGHGSLTHVEAKIGRRYSFRGKRLSYTAARCSDGVLSTKGRFDFSDGTIIYGAVEKPCSVRR
jgi:hypothetical protein